MKKIDPTLLKEAKRQHAILTRGVEKVYPEATAKGEDGLLHKLVTALTEKRPLKIKFGMDPTAPDIHLGHTVVLTLLRRFQDLGHVAMLLIGDYTCRIGDPSGRDKTRPPLTGEQIDANAKTYFKQAFKVLSKEKNVLDLRYNGEWLKNLSFADTIKLCSQVTASQILARDSFATRLKNGVPISIHELLYPIMQGYDSVAMKCDIELGGTDQTFNCLMGRQLMHARGMEEQVVMTMPLLEGTDGVEKMSKSKNNYIGVEDAPNEMFGKIMSIPDEIMNRYFELLTDEEIKNLPNHPMDAKKLLAKIIITRFHNEAAAANALEDFTTKFSKRDIPKDLPEHKVQLEKGEIGLLTLMVNIGFAPSNAEARRLVQQGAVKQDGEALKDVHTVFTQQKSFVLQAGKRRMARVKLRP